MKHIFVIAGHGGRDSGAVGNGYTEAERVRVLAKRIKHFGGGNVTLGDINRDYYADGLLNVLNIPKDWQIIELHMDSNDSSAAKGAHVIIKAGYEPDKYDNALASFLSGMFPGRSSIIVGRSDLANVNRAARRGFGYRLLECGFISNSNDVRVFNSKMDEIAKGILGAFGIASAQQNSIKQNAGNTAYAEDRIHYRAHSQTVGILPVVRDGQTAGITGHSKRLEGLYIDLRKLREKYPSAKLKAKAHIQGTGWKLYENVEHDTLIGTQGQGKRLEAIELDLIGVTGKTLLYRTHLAKDGWTGWVRGGFASGTVGIGKRIEAIQIKVE